MTLKRPPFLLALLSALLVITVVPGSCIGVKYKTVGTYVDASAGQHAWSVDGNHALIWDGEPYIPVGGTFVPSYTSSGATEENYQSDVKALETLKSKGITDIILKSTGPITATDPAAWQKIISYLDSSGFTYGLEMDDGPKDALKGYIVAPNVYKIEGPYPETSIACNWPGVESAIFVVLKRYDNSIKTTGGAIVREGKATVHLAEPLASGDILFVYPRKTFKTTAEGGMGDIWTGFGEYRDRVMEFFKSIKFGKGLRFFMEPFTSKMDFSGEMGGFVPDSPGFRLGFEAYLTKKYIHEGVINTQWAMNDVLGSVEQATRLTPLWLSGRGAPYFYDRTNAKLHSTDPSSTSYWTDLVDYRDTSAQGYMNTIADTLKTQVANVPVVFKCSSYHRIYATPFGIGGFDGLGATVRGTGELPVTRAAGPAYSLAEECGKTTWFIVDAQVSTGTKIGYSSEMALSGSMDMLREVGCKGFFVDGLIDNPPQIDWLGKFKGSLKPGALAEFKPQVVYFPSSAPTGAYARRLGPGAWWLPTLRMGKASYIGDGMSAYTIAGEDRSYLWSSTGDTPLTFKTPPMGLPSIEYPQGGKIGGGRKGGKFAITLTANPTVLRGADINMLFPFETADAELARLVELIPEADKAGLDVKQARAILDQTKTVLANGQCFIAFSMAQSSIQSLVNQMGSNLWVEAEQSGASNFGVPTATPGASEGMALDLDTADDAPLSPYTAYCRFNTTSNASYEVWIAGSPLSESSPISFCVDDGAWTPANTGDSKPATYAPGLSWYKIGAANLFPGNHTLKLRATGRRSSDNRYHFVFDAAVLSPKGFKPNGVKKPY